MKAEKVFKRYDIRGKYPEELDEEFAEKLGKSLGTFVRKMFPATVVIGRDNKDTSAPLKEALADGLKSSGVEPVEVGVGPTDYTAFCGKQKGVVSVQVTSSHMPLEFNGFKFMYPEGNGFVNEDLNKVKDIFRSGKFDEGQAEEVNVEEEMREAYRKSVVSKASELGSEKLDSTIVVDTLGGATTDFLPSLLEEMGAKVIDISERYDEHPYRDPPNPKPGQLEELKQVVDSGEADLGLAADMDGDRIAVYTSRFLSGDEIFNILAQKIEGDAVASIDSSKALEDLLRERGDEVFYTRVGDPFVMDKALKEEVLFAGEPNGHYSVLDFVPYNSGILTGLIVAGLDIEDCLGKMPDYSVERYSFETGEKRDKMERVKELVKEKYTFVSDIDGVKFETENCDVLVRPSGSSPKIRVIAESVDDRMLENEFGDVKEVIEDA